jgi:hypothetical protein
LRCSGADTRPACELHTVNLWQSHANTDGHSHGDSHSDSNTYGYSDSYAYADGNANSYAYADTYADGYDPAANNPDAEATSDTAASPVSGSGKLIVRSAAGVERPRLRGFLPQASSHPGTKFAC